MNCKQAREEILLGSGTPQADAHVRGCAECAAVLAGLKQTMSMMDEWQAPEPSPYFDARLRARLRAEAERPATWREWLAAAASPFTQIGRRVALATTAAVLLGAGVTLYQNTPAQQPVDTHIEAQAMPGTPVKDLGELDKNRDLLAGLDLLVEEGEITP